MTEVRGKERRGDTGHRADSRPGWGGTGQAGFHGITEKGGDTKLPNCSLLEFSIQCLNLK